MGLGGKIAVVTGGGSGVGAAIARRFAEAGAQVVIVGRRLEQLQAACDEIKAAKPVWAVAADVASRDEVGRLVEQVNADVGPIDILVNNAGVNIVARRLEELSPADWDYLIDVNATGAFNMIHAILPQMRARSAGLIISVSRSRACGPARWPGRPTARPSMPWPR